MLYPLSIGPACLVYDRYGDDRMVNPFNALYSPIYWCCDKSERIAETLAWYIHLWVR